MTGTASFSLLLPIHPSSLKRRRGKAPPASPRGAAAHPLVSRGPIRGCVARYCPPRNAWAHFQLGETQRQSSVRPEPTHWSFVLRALLLLLAVNASTRRRHPTPDPCAAVISSVPISMRFHSRLFHCRFAHAVTPPTHSLIHRNRPSHPSHADRGA